MLQSLTECIFGTLCDQNFYSLTTVVETLGNDLSATLRQISLDNGADKNRADNQRELEIIRKASAFTYDDQWGNKRKTA